MFQFAKYPNYRGKAFTGTLVIETEEALVSVLLAAGDLGHFVGDKALEILRCIWKTEGFFVIVGGFGVVLKLDAIEGAELVIEQAAVWIV